MFGLQGQSGLSIVGYAIGQLSTTRQDMEIFKSAPELQRIDKVRGQRHIMKT